MIYTRDLLLEEIKRVATGLHPSTSPEVIAARVSEDTGAPEHLVLEVIQERQEAPHEQ